MSTVISVTPSDTSVVTPVTKQWKGLRWYLTALWSGPKKPSDVDAPVDHAAWARSIGRKLALPLMFLFSFGAVIQLTGRALQQDITWLTKGDFVSLGANALSIVVILVVSGLVIGMDLLMVIKCVDWIDKRANDQTFASERAIVFFVAFVESVTFAMLLQSVEHPAAILVNGKLNGDGLSAWGLILIRVLGVPIVTIGLATLGDKVITEAERIKRQLNKVDNVIAKSMDQLMLTPSIDAIPMLNAYRLTLLDLTPDEEKKKAERNARLQEHFDKLTPGAIQQAAQQQVDALIAQVAQEKAQMAQAHQSAIEKVIADAEARLAEVTRDVHAEIQRLLSNFVPMFVSAITNNEWPQELLAHTPAFAHVDPHTFVQQAGFSVESTAPRVTSGASFSTNAPQRAPANPAQPAPGSKKFSAALYDAARGVTQSGKTLSIYELSQAMGQPTEVIQETIERLKTERLGKLRPGKPLAPDPILDVL